MREKNTPKYKLVGMGKKLSCLCKDSGVTFIVNDDPKLAKEVNADGVHLGQDDIKKYPIDETRKTLGPDKIIGISTHSLEQFSKVNNEGFDYMAFGPIFPTKTKDYFLGAGSIKNILNIALRPVFFIGGINLSNIDWLLEAGAKNIALIRGIIEAGDIVSAAGEFKNRLNSLKSPSPCPLPLRGRGKR
ncbi:MAG: thiamine-phosphate diphosphorylase [Omnitrophica bacterium RIFCSPLOWO2_02_FULL_45_16]|nr:MAG: thiamine-phosphate diphosphorylase [Omnitrophica bacterium RIFCSPLOWO2_02_FULL_45_16]